MDEIENVNQQISKLKDKKKNMIQEKKINKNNHRKEKIKNGKTNSNILRRMSMSFYEKFLYANDKREEMGFEKLSLPEYTNLIVKHQGWTSIISDIIHFNKEIENNGGIPNE